jgi:multicomponent Na+:H+ antiporter subunit A
MSHTHDTLSNGRIWLWLVLLPFSLFIALIWGLNQTSLPWHFHLPWIPSLDIALAFRIDGLSAQMLALITGIGTLIFIYAVGYLDHEPRRGRLFFVLPLFMLAMIGAVSADDVVVLFLFWELTSITSFLLVGFNHTQAAARESARQALLVTMSGGLALLGGLLLLTQIAQTRLLSEIIATAPNFQDDPRLPYAIGLILIGAFTKSAQFPFHFWLPNAMSAPTPVSAYLHSATMVKLGIYLMARLDPAFNDLLLWEVTLISVGTITAVWAAVLALRERDLKRILARSTVSALGTLTLLIGLPSPSAGLAVVTFLFAHAIYKAPLFMVAGNIDHATGTRDIDRLMGLRRVMPWSAAAAILAGLSMAGLPLAFGFVAKDTISLAKEQADLIAVVSYAFVFVNATAVAVAGVAAIRVFWGPLETPYQKVHETPWLMLLPPLLIALIGIEFEFFPHIADPLLFSASQSIAPNLSMQEAAISYELSKLLTATAITVSIGVLLFMTWDRLHNALNRIHWLDSYGAEASYNILLSTLPRIAAWHTRLLQNGRLDNYLLLSLTALFVMSGFAAWHTVPHFSLSGDWHAHAWAWLMASVLMVAGAIAAARLQDRLAALMASGLVGYGAALLFLFAGSPDLAFTQFSVETALVVIAAAVLPRFAAAPRTESPVIFKFILTAVAGVATFGLLLHLQGLPENRILAEWFAAHSLSEAYGRNVVNVIIVDFRALDTLGEIAVVAFALLAALPLLNSIKSTQTTSATSPMLYLAALPLYWLMLAVSVWILMRGHNAPGGGFIGGLVAVAASSLLATLRSPTVALRFQPLSPLTLALVGLVLALIGGLIGLLFGDGFLRHVWVNKYLSSVLLFDLGVFFVVWGVLTGYIYALLQPDSNASSLTEETP